MFSFDEFQFTREDLALKTDVMRYATIYNTIHLSEISIIKNLLEENNIEYLTPDEFTNNASGIGGLGMAGMRVQVLEEDRKRAVAILRDRGFS